MDRTNVVSSYTIVKGSLIDETYSIMAAWDFSQSKKQNMDRLRKTNFIEARSDSRLRDVAKIFNCRFDPAARDHALALLAKSGLGLEEWKPLLLWHLAQGEVLFKNFLIHWLFPTCYDSSAYRVQHEDLQTYLLTIGKRAGVAELAWSTTTLHRVATMLIKVATDFGLLKGRAVKEFTSYILPERSFIYLLHFMLEKYESPRKVINAVEWRMFLLCPSDVERELLRLNQIKKLKYEVVDNLPRISLRCKSAREHVEKMRECAPGDRCEVDYAADKIDWLDPKTGEIYQAHIFIGVLGFSGLNFAWASENEEGPNWLQAHRKMFDAFGGVPHVIVCDYLKPGIIKTHRYHPDLSPGYAEIAAHYMTTIIPVSAGHTDKAMVDAAARVLMRTFRFIYCRHTFTSITEINHALSHVVGRINRKVRPHLKMSRLQLWASQEKHALNPLPTLAFEAVEWKLARVHPDCTISFESAYYSVPYQHQGKDVRIKLSGTHVEIFVDLERVALHKRDFSRHGSRNIIPEHLIDNTKAYQGAVPQDLLSQATLVTKSLYRIIDELFSKDTLGNLRRAHRFIRRAHLEIEDCGREIAEPRIHEAIEQMRQFNNFSVYYFEATLHQLRQETKRSRQAENGSKQ